MGLRTMHQDTVYNSMRVVAEEAFFVSMCRQLSKRPGRRNLSNNTNPQTSEELLGEQGAACARREDLLLVEALS